MASDPAEGLAVEAAPVWQPHAADGQRGLPVPSSHLHAAVLTLNKNQEINLQYTLLPCLAKEKHWLGMRQNAWNEQQ